MWLSCCKLLRVRSFVLEVRSRSGHDVPVNFHQTNVILCSDKKGQGPKAQLSPSEALALRGLVTLPGSIHPAPSLRPPTSAQAQLGRQISAGGILLDRSLDSTQPSSLREPGPQDPASSGCPNGRGQVPGTETHADCRCH